VLIEELLLPDGYAVMLRKPVLIEPGQTFWVEGDSLVVEDATGQQRRFAGDEETRCYRG
jgi:hypothetical protein